MKRGEHRPSQDLGEWLNGQVEGLDDCPLRLFSIDRFEQNCLSLQAAIRNLAGMFDVDFDISYSMKTNPNSEVLMAAQRAGIGNECISLAELKHAQRLGFSGGECTLNGPGKWWPCKLLSDVQEPAIVNCDSVCDLVKTIDVLESQNWNTCILGVRISPPGIRTRFGINLEDQDTFVSLYEIPRQIPNQRRLGIHFHAAQSSLGAKAWVDAACRAIELSESAFSYAARKPINVDVGGGWQAGEIGSLEESLQAVCKVALDTFDSVRSLQLEPGKFLSEDCGYVVCRVLGRRGAGAHTDVVVSAACCDVPDMISFDHKVMWRKANGGPWHLLQEGSGRVLGRICMEADILRKGVWIPRELDEGDLVAICGTGAYDTSMSFPFGTGEAFGDSMCG